MEPTVPWGFVFIGQSVHALFHIAGVSLAQFLTGLLRAGGVAVCPGSGFAGGIKLNLIRTAHGREELNVEVVILQ